MLSQSAVAGQHYAWQRIASPICEPKLAFDTHYQGDGLPVSPHSNLLVGVSGGSDSMALLHLLHEWLPHAPLATKIHVATVDHGLRKASRSEADTVAKTCELLGLRHQILTWENPEISKPSSQDARLARYRLLLDHAKSIDATCLLLGHTKNDQAETVLMRAQRSTSESSMRGLSSMTQWSHHASPEWSLSIYRPLLHVRREKLRDHLRRNAVDWIEDPTNHDINSERVRVRRYLEQQPITHIDQLANLSCASAAHRAWMSAQSAALIETHASFDDLGNCTLEPASRFPQSILPVASDALSALILAVGGKPYRVPTAKTQEIATVWQNGTPMRTNLGRTLISASKRGLKISREARGLDPLPTATNIPQLYDGRMVISQRCGTSYRKPFIVGLESFLPSTDFPVRRAIMRLLNESQTTKNPSIVQHTESI